MAEVAAAFHDFVVAGCGAEGVVVIGVGALVEVGAPPVGAPFPGVANHRIQAVVIWWEGSYRTGAGKAVVGGVFLEIFLEMYSLQSSHRDSIRYPMGTPCGRCRRERRIRIRPQLASVCRPGGVGGGVKPGHVVDRMVHAPFEFYAGAFGGAPASTIDTPPPFEAADGL